MAHCIIVTATVPWNWIWGVGDRGLRLAKLWMIIFSIMACKRFIFLGLGRREFLSNPKQNLVYFVLLRCPIYHASGSYYYPVLQDLYVPEGNAVQIFWQITFIVNKIRTIACQELIRESDKEKLTIHCSASALLSVLGKGFLKTFKLNAFKIYSPRLNNTF